MFAWPLESPAGLPRFCTLSTLNLEGVFIIDRPLLTDDLRRSQRNPVSWRARVSLANSSLVDCRTSDISRGGVGLVSATGFQAGALLMVALQVPDAPFPSIATGQIVACKAKVAFQVLSAGQYRTGFEWIAPSDAALAALAPWTGERRR